MNVVQAFSLQFSTSSTDCIPQKPAVCRHAGLVPNGVDLTPAERASVGLLTGKRWRFLARPGAPGSADFCGKPRERQIQSTNQTVELRFVLFRWFLFTAVAFSFNRRPIATTWAVATATARTAFTATASHASSGGFHFGLVE